VQSATCNGQRSGCRRYLVYWSVLIHSTVSKSLFTAFLLSLTLTAFSQDYVVTMKSDTIVGNVKLLSYDLVDRVQVNVDKKKLNFTALQIRRAVIKGEQYAPVKLDKSIRLMKIIRSGFLSLYAHRAQGQATYDSRIIQKIGLDAAEVPNIGFKKYVGELVSDCPTVSDKVQTGDFDRSKLELLIDEYNTCIKDYNSRRMEAAAAAASPVAELIDQMKTKVESSGISNKSDVNDLLNSIAERYKKREAIPGYMKEGLKGYLASNDELKADMEKLFTLIDK